MSERRQDLGGWKEVGGSRGGMRRCETRERVDHGPFLLLARANAPSRRERAAEVGTERRLKCQKHQNSRSLGTFLKVAQYRY